MYLSGTNDLFFASWSSLGTLSQMDCMNRPFETVNQSDTVNQQHASKTVSSFPYDRDFLATIIDSLSILVHWTYEVFAYTVFDRCYYAIRNCLESENIWCQIVLCVLFSWILCGVNFISFWYWYTFILWQWLSGSHSEYLTCYLRFIRFLHIFDFIEETV